MKNFLIGLVVVIALVAGTVYFMNRDNQESPYAEPAPPVAEPGPVPPIENPPLTASVTIHMTENGFNSNDVTIKKEQSVTFINDVTADHWPASAMHPTHTVYPNSDIKKCGTEEQFIGKSLHSSIFDACKGLKPGESWTFTFTNVGTWRYHDHLTPSLFGKVTVTE